MPAPKGRNIFCLEGPWDHDLRNKSSLRPLLELADDYVRSSFIFRDASTSQELRQYLKQWSQRQYASYSIGVLSAHGAAGELLLLRERVSLEELAEVLEGRCRDRLLHFDSCCLLDVPAQRLQEFRRRTGAKAVSGYTKSVDWLDTAAFMLHLLDVVTRDVAIIRALRMLRDEQPAACRRLGFRALWATGSIGSRRR